MEINRLYTLVQFVEYLYSERDVPIKDIFKAKAGYFDIIVNYMQFLKQLLTKEMFVNSVEKPKMGEGWDDEVMKSYEYLTWDKGEKKVIFKDFYIRKWEKGEVLQNDVLDIFIDLNEHETISDLTKGTLELKNVNL